MLMIRRAKMRMIPYRFGVGKCTKQPQESQEGLVESKYGIVNVWNGRGVGHARKTDVTVVKR
jgi:hypothetical protein